MKEALVCIRTLQNSTDNVFSSHKITVCSLDVQKTEPGCAYTGSTLYSLSLYA
jgi:hypothetical protein